MKLVPDHPAETVAELTWLFVKPPVDSLHLAGSIFLRFGGFPQGRPNRLETGAFYSISLYLIPGQVILSIKFSF